MKTTYVRLRERVSRQVAKVRHTYHEAFGRGTDGYGGEQKKSATFGVSKISGPKLAEQYKVIADYQKEDKWDLNLKAGTEVEVVEKSESGWWFVNVEDQQGWVPSTYLKRKDGTTENTSQRAQKGEEESYMCTDNYDPQNNDEIRLDLGATVEVMEKNLDGWWWIRYQGKEGWAPATYLMKSEKVHMEQVAQASGVQIVSQLSDISNLMKGEGHSADGVTPPRPKAPMIRQKSKSLERGGSLRPPPRKGSIKNIDLNAVHSHRLTSKSYVTLADFNDKVGDGISFRKGEFVQVIEKTDDGWWFVSINGAEGWAPSTYIGNADIGDIPEASSGPTADEEYSCVPPPSDDEEDYDYDSDYENPYEDVDPDSGYEVPCNNNNNNTETTTKKLPDPPVLRQKPVAIIAQNVDRDSVASVGRMQRGKDVKRPTSRPPPPPVISVPREQAAPKESKKEEPLSKLAGNAANLKAQLEAKFSSTSSSSSGSKSSPPPRPAKPKELSKPTNSNSSKPTNKDSLAGMLKAQFERRTSSASESSSSDGHSYPRSQIKPPTPPKSDRVKRLSNVGEGSDLSDILKAKFEQRRCSEDSVTKSNTPETSKKHVPLKPLLPPKSNVKPEERSKPPDIKRDGVSATKSIFEANNVSKPPVLGKTWKKESVKPSKKPPPKPLKPSFPKQTNSALNGRQEVGGAPKPGFAKELAAKLSNNLPSSNNTSQSTIDFINVNKPSAIKPPIPTKNTTSTSGLDKHKAVEKVKTLYKAKADFKGQGDGEVTFTAGETLQVEDKSGGWWLVAVGDRQGWAPATYIEEVSNDHTTSNRVPSPVCDSGFTSPEEGSNSSATQRFRTCAEFIAEGEGEISFSEGMYIEVLDSSEDDWWYVKINDTEGWVPAEYLEEVS
ncbi:hypothetical protein FSP39_017156 [Pinctada imbricata]|uniref:SH3 domain-containing protein n=1 Tax=Pinctada imbricata TaxID=66713 RepID=A0AA88YAV3_PINIB|nr:hypothetical protein FSP39_017156 [Pinctada imbricata]